MWNIPSSRFLGSRLLGFVRKPNMVLLWLVDALRDFAGFELARPLSNGKLVWKVSVPQPIAPAVKVLAKTETPSIQSLWEDIPLFANEAAGEGSTSAHVAQNF